MNTNENTKQKHSIENIVRVWQAANSRAEAAEALGLSIGIVSNTVAALRKQGVNLKKFPRGRRPSVGPVIDVEHLNQVINELESK
jgi:transposase